MDRIFGHREVELDGPLANDAAWMSGMGYKYLRSSERLAAFGAFEWLFVGVCVVAISASARGEVANGFQAYGYENA